MWRERRRGGSADDVDIQRAPTTTAPPCGEKDAEAVTSRHETELSSTPFSRSAAVPSPMLARSSAMPIRLGVLAIHDSSDGCHAVWKVELE
jgi:hypothetical protein